MSVTIKKHRTTDGKIINGMVYDLTFASDTYTNTVTIETKKTNPISEDKVKHLLVTMAAHDDLNAFIAAISEDLTVRDSDTAGIVCTDPYMLSHIPEDVIERSVIKKYNTRHVNQEGD